MTTILNAWVVCAPGDPTSFQWRAMRGLTGPRDSFCATRWNERSHYVRVEIDRGGFTDTYTISPDGVDVRYLGQYA